MTRWWGVIFKNNRIELKEFVGGDNTKKKFAYMNEEEIDFVIEPFEAESFEDAKVWVSQTLENSVVASMMLIAEFNERAKSP